MSEHWGAGAARRGPGPEHFRSTDNAFETMDLLIASGHVVPVIKVLDDLGVTYDQLNRDDSPDLGLTKLPLVPNDRWPAIPGAAGALGAGDDYVGKVIAAVKAKFQGEEPHRRKEAWVPTLGRNRTVGHVTNTDGRPIVTFASDPVVAATDAFPPGPWEHPPHGSIAGQPGYGVRVGVVDTALRPHPWLTGAPVSPYPTPLDGPDPAPVRAGHCDAMVGVILNAAPGAVVDVRGVFNDYGLSTTWELAKAIVALGDSGVDLINLSCAVYTNDAEPPLALSTAIDRLGPDVLVIAAAGNYAKEAPVIISAYDGTATFDFSVAPAWPAAIDEVIGVGSVGVQDSSWRISDFSTSADWVDVVAPGERVLSLAIANLSTDAEPTASSTVLVPGPGGYALWSGTSLSTAAVTGAIAKSMRPGETARATWDRLIQGRPRIAGSGIGPGPILFV